MKGQRIVKMRGGIVGRTVVATAVVILLLHRLVSTGKTTVPASFVGAAPLARTLSAKELTWGVIGDDRTHLAWEYRAGVRVKVVRISWKDFAPTPTSVDPSYVASIKATFAQIRAAGLGVILELGVQDTPTWLHARVPHSSYVDQYGDVYNGQGQADSGDANAVYNPVVRQLIAAYMRQVIADFGASFVAVRLGGGRYGELSYPPPDYNGHHFCYWAYDANARAASPTPGWRPGSSSPHGEAHLFLTAYLNALTAYQNWQVATLRRSYGGPIMMLYPSFGLRPGEVDAAVAGNLDGATAAEVNGETERGVDYARQVAALTDPLVWLTTTWLNCTFGDDASADPTTWRPVHYLAYLASMHRPRLGLYGENSGEGSVVQMSFSAAQATRYGLSGMAWYDEAQLFSGRFATVANYKQTIARASTPPTPRPWPTPASLATLKQH